VLAPLARRVGDEALADPVDVVTAPREPRRHDVGQALLGVHHPTGDGGHGVGRREPPPAGPRLGGQPEVGPYETDEVGGVGGVGHGERRVEPDEPAVAPQHAVGHGVEGAAPHAGAGRADPAQHLGGGAPAEGQEADAFGWHAPPQQASDPSGEGARLAAAGAGEHEQRPVAVVDGLRLGRREVLEHQFDSTRPPIFRR
jgi:hypothetical protein